MNPDRLDAALRMLRSSGDITPQGARILTQINDDEQPDPDPQHWFCDCPGNQRDP